MELCNCESYHHFDDTRWSDVQLGHDYLGVKVESEDHWKSYIGPVCDECDRVCYAEPKGPWH